MCEPAGALVITQAGEVEAVSRKCSAKITTFPKFSGTGRTSSLLDEELLLVGDDYLGTRGQYISIQKPREGLLAMKYTIEELPLTQAPHQHTSLVSGNTLAVVGGKFKSRGKFSKFTWTELVLKWENGTKFGTDFAGACAVKLDRDLHIIFGGETKVDKSGGRQVVKINTTEEIVYEMPPMSQGRVSHSCQLLNESIVLVSGGLSRKGQDPSEVLPDELYNITSGEVVKVLDFQESLLRIQHSTTKIGDNVWAIGGIDSSNKAPSKIAQFNSSTTSWSTLSKWLKSTNTSNLVVTPFPEAAFDCVSQCHCGISNRRGRIFGGNEAEVFPFYLD